MEILFFARPAPMRDGLFLKGCCVSSLYVLPILLFSIVVHEIAHGWVALRLGDSTALDAGRLTFNPIPHIDPIGSIAIPLLSFISAGSVFIAWAKPVPINPAYFRNFRRDDILVSVAGPVSNLLMACLCSILYVFSTHMFSSMMLAESDLQREIATYVVRMFAAGITLNIFLAIFNLIPVPPLDGSHVLAAFLPQKIGDQYRQIGFFGIILVIMLMRVPLFRQAVFSLVLTLRMPLDMFIRLFT
jgi:Zn-dependent protease